MEAADDAPLSYLGFPDKILTYSTLKSWFLQTTPKALVLSSFITILIIILFLETLFLYHTLASNIGHTLRCHLLSFLQSILNYRRSQPLD